jgi:hypothetical protein
MTDTEAPCADAQLRTCNQSARQQMPNQAPGYVLPARICQKGCTPCAHTSPGTSMEAE